MMKPHGIKFTQSDWNVIQQAASDQNMSAGAFVNMCVKEYFEAHGIDFEGTQPHGGPREKKIPSDLWSGK